MHKRAKKRNKGLGNGITTDTQLADYGTKHIPGFRGVFSRDQMKDICSRLGPGESVILNLDPGYSRGGTHWVALRVSIEAPIVYYKDSFGAPPPNDIAGCFEGLGVVYGNRIYQKLSEQNCGQRALKFLQSMQAAASRGAEIEWFSDSET